MDGEGEAPADGDPTAENAVPGADDVSAASGGEPSDPAGSSTAGAVARDYDAVAADYAREVGGELAGKPLDRALLTLLATSVPSVPPGATIADLGCGPGHVARFLADHAPAGTHVVGIDLSPGMIEQARTEHPDLRFEVGDLRALPLPTASVHVAVAFYSLIHFDDPADLPRACAEIARVLAPGGQVLVAYHRGAEVVRPEAMWGTPVTLAFRYLSDRDVTAALAAAGLQVTARVRREPYPGVEHASRRSYLLAARAD